MSLAIANATLHKPTSRPRRHRATIPAVSRVDGVKVATLRILVLGNQA